jgi:hypothetical protein
MQYGVIAIRPEISDLNLLVHGPFENADKAEELLERWLNLHPGTRGVVRSLIRPSEMPWDGLYEDRGLFVDIPVSSMS